MDNFRWILLAVGIVIIVIIYMISRKNKRDFYRDDDDDVSEDLPELKSTGWDDLDEGVGEVRIIAHADDDVTLYEDKRLDAATIDEQHETETEAAIDDNDIPVVEDVVEYGLQPEPEPKQEPELEPEAEELEPQAEQEASAEPAETVLVLNIMARDGSTLAGKSINSVAHANNMVFGEMNIYHHLDQSNEPVFSMINMVKPGSFDPSTIHELSTPGISMFMQLPGPSNASEAFDVMLQTAYSISETLEARLCDRRRQPLTESVVEEYRNTAASFDGKN